MKMYIIRPCFLLRKAWLPYWFSMNLHWPTCQHPIFEYTCVDNIQVNRGLSLLTFSCLLFLKWCKQFCDTRMPDCPHYSRQQPEQWVQLRFVNSQHCLGLFLRQQISTSPKSQGLTLGYFCYLKECLKVLKLDTRSNNM